MSASAFRSDINGLRAWAVLLVVLFHFRVPGLGAGFIGVDVFFVISGYLMASILFRDLATGRLSLMQFYASRVRRIYPALLTLCMVCLAVGAFLLMPEDYEQLGRHVRESVTFSSNYQYLSEAGYFDAAAESKWLLHTWSLSVEWQFYLLYPLLALILFRCGPQHPGVWLLATLLLGLLSLSWNQHLTRVNPDQAFYGFPGRAWELLLGAAVFHISQLGTRPASMAPWLHYGGLGLILMAACLVAPSHWPGLWALIPTLGAGLLILGRHRSPLTEGRFWNWCGERSYSIYLWHWPVMVLLHYFTIAQRPAWIVAGLLAALLLAELSYRLVERPARRHLGRLRPGRSLLCLLPAILIVFALGQLVRHDGFPERLPDDVVRLVDPEHLTNPRQDECLGPEHACHYGQGPLELIVAGDSHADAVVTAVAAALSERPASLLFKGDSSCLPLPGLHHVDPRMDECLALGAALPAILTEHPGIPLLLVTHLTPYVNGGQVDPDRRVQFIPPGAPDTYSRAWFTAFESWYLEQLCQLRQERPVWVLQPVPEMAVDVATALGRQRLLGQPADLSRPRREYEQRNAYTRQLQDRAAARCGVQLLDPAQVLCDAERCHAERDGWPLYRDDNHLSEYGNRLLVPLFERVGP